MIEPEVVDAARESVRLRTELGDLLVSIDVVVIDRERARRRALSEGLWSSARCAGAGFLPTPEEVEVADLLLRKVASDLSAARALARDPEQQDDVVGFHAQQAIEKSLKRCRSSFRCSALCSRPNAQRKP